MRGCGTSDTLKPLTRLLRSHPLPPGEGEGDNEGRAIPDAARHAMLRCWSGTHRLLRIMDPVSAQHRFALQCARDGGDCIVRRAAA